MNHFLVHDNIYVTGKIHYVRSENLDTTELSELIHIHGKAIYRFCYMLTKKQADTDDLYQETFLKATELRHKIDKNKNPKAFLISIAIRLHQNNRRKFAWRQKIAPTEALNENIRCNIEQECHGTPEDIALSNELRITLRTAADCLKDSLKIPLYMYYTAEMSIEEIASALKIPQGTVKSRLHKARAMLKQVLNSGGDAFTPSEW